MADRPTYVWTGSDWDTIADPGAVRKSLIDDAGDLIVGSADNTVGRLALGSDGQVLTVDTAGTGVAKVKWADAAAGGSEANRNLLINGAMQVAQRGTSVTGISSSGVITTADRWLFGVTNLGNIGTWSQTIETDAPTGSGFAKSFKALCTTAGASPNGNAIVAVTQALEGQDLQRIRKGSSDAQQLTVSFWVKSNVTGTYILWLFDNDNSRHVAASYTVLSSATWEKKTITFPADTTGALDNDNASSFLVRFYLAAGTDFTSGTLATAWATSTAANRAVGQTNLAAATNNYWQITGVQLEVGPVATPFEFEPYEATLRKCQRYYYLYASGNSKFLGIGGYTSSGTALQFGTYFPTTMRTAPTLVLATGADYYRDPTSGDNFDSFIIFAAQENATLLFADTLVSGTNGDAVYIRTNNASASVAFSAEL
jgi:hypothetical protein